MDNSNIDLEKIVELLGLIHNENKLLVDITLQLSGISEDVRKEVNKVMEDSYKKICCG